MSIELTEQQQQQQQEAQQKTPRGPGDEIIQGVPAHLYRQIMAIRPGDAQALAQLLSLFGSTFAPNILEIAAGAPQLGNSVVQAAIRIASGRNATGAPNSLRQDEIREGGDLALESSVAGPSPAPGPHRALSNVEQSEILNDASDSKAPSKAEEPARSDSRPLNNVEQAAILRDPTDAKALNNAEQAAIINDPTDAPSAAPATDRPAGAQQWQAATRYNRNHPELVAQFNKHTNHVCVDEAGELDPAKVADWQSSHGVTADGMVGPQTVAAARKNGESTPVASADVDARPDV